MLNLSLFPISPDAVPNLPKVAHVGDAGADIKAYFPKSNTADIFEVLNKLEKEEFNSSVEEFSSRTYINGVLATSLSITEIEDLQDGRDFAVLSPLQSNAPFKKSALISSGFKLADLSIASYGQSYSMGSSLPALLILSRSGLSNNPNTLLTVPNSPGLVDSQYRGEIKVGLVTHSKNSHIITHGTRIAQMIVLNLFNLAAAINISEDWNSSTARGEGGFGSTSV